MTFTCNKCGVADDEIFPGKKMTGVCEDCEYKAVIAAINKFKKERGLGPDFDLWMRKRNKS